MSKQAIKAASSLLLLLAALAIACQASIEREPVKVTYKNSGPVYDISEDGDKIKVSSVVSSNDGPAPKPVASSGSGSNNDDGEHFTVVRRVYLVPMRWSQPSADRLYSNPPFMRPKQDEEENEGPMPPMNFHRVVMDPVYRHHLFGADVASRSPTPESSSGVPKFAKPSSADGTEREESTAVDHAQDPVVDPVNMLVNMMLNSILSQTHPSASSPNEPTNFFKDLNKEASNKPTDASDMTPMGDKPIKPPTRTNETKEEIVEIDGKKFLKKTQINRHVGENLVFMTRRLIFVPLNETDSEPMTTTLAPSTVDTSTTPSGEAPSSTTEPKESEATTSTSQISSSTTAIPNVSSEQPGLERERLVAKPNQQPGI